MAVLAATKEQRLAALGMQLQRPQVRALVRTIAEWLFATAPAAAPEIILTGHHLHRIGSTLGNLYLTHRTLLDAHLTQAAGMPCARISGMLAPFQHSPARPMTLPRPLRHLLLGLLSSAIILAALVYSLTWHPTAREPATLVCAANAPVLQPGQALKVMTWNVQFLAGKRYVFWHDLAAGQDQRPTATDLAYNLDEVARVIRDEQPDLVLLQELHNGARASDYQNQLKLLQERLNDLYPCSAATFYWQAAFVPHPQIMGSVGMQLATLSRVRIARAERLQLPRVRSDLLSRQFQPQHALLTTYLPLANGQELVTINTQLADPNPTSDDGARQIAMSGSLLDQLESQRTPWLFAGDLNQLPPGPQYQQLTANQRQHFKAHSELTPLLARYPSIPTTEEASQPAWHTQYPNDPQLSAADRTVDYLLYSPRLVRLDARVRSNDTQRISDHLPLSARLLLPLD